MTTNLFEVRHTQNKGRGLFALQNIPKGCIVLQEKVLWLCMHSDRSDEVWKDPEFWAELKIIEETPGIPGFGEIARLARQYMEEATAEGFDSIMELPRAHPEFRDPLVDIYLTNRLRLGENLCWTGLGKHSSIINHGCISNAHLSSDWGNESERQVTAYVKATKDIAAQEEITISYIDVADDREKRQRCLQEFFSFVCACDICQGVDWVCELHMTALATAYELSTLSSGVAKPWSFFRDAAKIHWYLSQLNISDRRIADVWLKCGAVAAYHSDAVRARRFFRYACAWHLIARQEDCEQVEKLTSWSNMPTQHREWGETNQGASDLSYDPILDDDDERHGQTLRLLFMTDYETGEYRRIAVGADRNLSRRAKAMIRERGAYYAAKMEVDAKRMDRAALEEAKQKAREIGDALIAEIDMERPKTTAQGESTVQRTAKKAKKRKKKQIRGDSARVATDIEDGQTSVVAEPASIKEGAAYPFQSDLADVMSAEDTAYASDGCWETVKNRKGKDAKDKEKKKLTKGTGVGTVDKSKDAHIARYRGKKYRLRAENDRERRNLSVRRGEEHIHKMVDAEQPGDQQDQVKEQLHSMVDAEQLSDQQGQADEADSASANTEKEHVPTDQGTTDTDLSSKVFPEVMPGQAAEKADKVDEFGERAAVAALAQAASHARIRRPHATSCPIYVPPLERELTIYGLKDGIRVRRAKVQKLAEEIKELRRRFSLLPYQAMSDADWDDVKADHKAYAECLNESVA